MSRVPKPIVPICAYDRIDFAPATRRWLLRRDGREFIVYAENVGRALATFREGGFRLTALADITEAPDDEPMPVVIDERKAPGA